MREYPNIITDLEKWPIARFYDDRQRVVRQLSQSTQAFLNGPGQSRNLQTTLRETIYSEKLRAKSNPLKVDPPKEYAYWKKMEADLGRAMQDDAGARATLDILGRTVNRYSEEIAGNFNVKTFRFARKALSMLFGSLYKPFFANGKAFWGDRESLLDRFEVVGPLDHIRGLFDKGTVMILPTHFSNLDSILIGYGIEMMTGMPAFSYGAGLNLYDYELMAYYMSRLGAYKIDRRKKNPVYAETLRQFSILSIHEGLNSIFFPGGTRSRSGAIEDRVKLGLMNTLIDSQNDFYMRGQDRKIIAIPLVISYNFVLEASSLIEQHLRKTGKASYLNSTRKSKVRNKTFKFINRLFKSQSGVTLSFGQPMDVMGHLLDEEGNSIKGGRTIDIKGYFTSSGLLTKDVQRNRVYSRLFGNAITSSFRRENVVLVSHLVPFVAFEMFRKGYPNLDLFAVLNLPKDYCEIPVTKLYEQIDIVREKILRLERQGKIKANDEVRSMSSPDLVKSALSHLSAYHFRAPLIIHKEMVRSEDLKLLYYYRNRLEGYNLNESILTDRVTALRLTAPVF